MGTQAGGTGVPPAGVGLPVVSTSQEAVGNHGTRLDDAAVIEESRDEPERFAVLFDRHAGEVHRYIRRRLGREVADDLVGETFLVAFRKRARYESARRDARPWLYGIATNLIGLHRRSEARKYRALARHGIDPVTEGRHDHADDVASDVAAQSRSPELAAALTRLSKRDRDVLLLFAWQDLGYDEIAQALGIPSGTVRSRLNRARKKVRAELDEAATTLTREEASYG